MKKSKKSNQKNEPKELIQLVEIEPRSTASEDPDTVEQNHYKEMIKIIKRKPYHYMDMLQDLPIPNGYQIVIKHRLKHLEEHQRTRILNKYIKKWWLFWEIDPYTPHQKCDHWLESYLKEFKEKN
ncbi:hypothetical protein [Francisella salina]|uniref:Uncharacterized protein n=1 Tax=Francisella salina TaxID=573569 RepID=A0ABM5M9F7_FRAST|nr:hypothetical protein [Francisella salina]AEI35832.1 hypothetical protein F7308_0905 [Francisella salina]